MFDTGKKDTIWHYGLSRNPGNNFGKAVNVMHIAYFCENFVSFSFYEKVPSPFDPVAFFPKYFCLNSPWYFQLILYSFTKRVYKIAIKRNAVPKHFLEVTKGIDPYSE